MRVHVKPLNGTAASPPDHWPPPPTRCRIRKFAARNLEVAVQLATAYAWLTSMMVIALVPIDVWGAYTQSPSTKPIFILWNVAYW